MSADSRVALLADIHGNIHALDAVLEDVRATGARHLLIAGDFVGYYYHPEAIRDRLGSWSYDAVQGNHDALLAQVQVDHDLLQDYRGRYGHGLDVALSRLTPADREWFGRLPHPWTVEIDGRAIMLCHGAPWDRDAYIYPDASPDLLSRCAAEGPSIVVMGHTHHPMVRRVDRTLLINPGAVGQPRDGDPRASWVLLDVAARTTQIRRVSYSVAQVVTDAQRFDPDLPYLAEVLLRTEIVPRRLA